MKKNIFIGGAWPYANNLLHIGHIAALLPGDTIARYYRIKKDNVIYVSGTDAHGTPITLRAKKENITPKEIATKYHEAFCRTFEDFEFSYDYYTSTMTDYHKQKVQGYLKTIKENGFLYEKLEDQDYCSTCELFLSDREILGTCPYCGGKATAEQCQECNATLTAKQALDKKCIFCNTPTEYKKNRHMYFALSKFQDQIKDLVQKNKNKWRHNATKETLKFLEQGLIDRAATRQLDWGVEVPFEGFSDKRIYVWFEAVMGYLSALEYVLDKQDTTLDKYLKSSNLTTYYAHGKDNIPFHTIIFPSLLKALDKDYHLPSYIISCEYFNMNDEKMSKSKGNLISADELLELIGVDSARFNILYNGPENKDVNFSLELLVQDHNKYLVGVIGNFVNRNLSFVNREFEGKINKGKINKKISAFTKETFKEVGKLIEEGKLKTALTKVVNYVVEANKYYDAQKPWLQVKEDIVAFTDTTYTCTYIMANMAVLFEPFVPGLGRKIREKLGLQIEQGWREVVLEGDLTIKNNDIFYERLKLEKVQEEYQKIKKEH